MNRKEYILILFSSLLIFGGCINEDLSDCPRGKYIYFKTNSPKYVYENIVKKVDLYLYDEGENLVSEYSCPREDLDGNNYRIYIPQFPNGNYVAVALVNQDNHYETLDKSKLTSLRTRLLTTSGDSVKIKPNDIYHSNKEMNFGDTYHITSDTMFLSKNTNHINLSVQIKDHKMPDANTLGTTITGANGEYNYNNRSVGNSTLTYIPHTTSPIEKVQNTIVFKNSTTIMRLWIDADLMVNVIEYENGVTPKNKPVASLNLMDMISKVKNDATGEYLYNTNEKLELEDEFNIEVIYDSSFSIIDLKVNDWFCIKNSVRL